MGLLTLKFPEEFAPVSADDYLRLKTNAETKHKFTNGRVLAMACATPAHNEIPSD